MTHAQDYGNLYHKLAQASRACRAFLCRFCSCTVHDDDDDDNADDGGDDFVMRHLHNI